MAATFALDSDPKARQQWGTVKVFFGTLTIASGSTYNANSGVDIGASIFNLTNVLAFVPIGTATKASNVGEVAVWNKSADRIRLFQSTTGAPADLVELGGVAADVTLNCMVIGT